MGSGHVKIWLSKLRLVTKNRFTPCDKFIMRRHGRNVLCFWERET